ncbi:helix-turn-helix transcriptional regulator [Bacillus sp. CGMCC 1.16541]|uniref:helix-turn-helix domain-containing protein n=1 Tax=Bacillus sp. CGMCC 1.16541 TaxID=2185143 RepID=UPI0013A53A21|nr:helix-turn-helix transcriptional regulator [Bacillus sp. CGMCC 1.16541]
MYSEDVFVKEFARKLRRKREEQSLSLNRLSEISSVSASFIFRIENGERNNISIEVLFNLSNALDIDLGEMLERCRSSQDK